MKVALRIARLFFFEFARRVSAATTGRRSCRFFMRKPEQFVVIVGNRWLRPARNRKLRNGFVSAFARARPLRIGLQAIGDMSDFTAVRVRRSFRFLGSEATHVPDFGDGRKKRAARRSRIRIAPEKMPISSLAEVPALCISACMISFRYGEIWWVTPEGWRIAHKGRGARIDHAYRFGDSEDNHPGLCRDNGRMRPLVDRVRMIPGTSSSCDNRPNHECFRTDGSILWSTGITVPSKDCFLLNYRMKVAVCHVKTEDKPHRLQDADINRLKRLLGDP